MTYTFQYGQVLGYLPYLLAGAWITLEIAFLAFLGGMLIGLAGAAARTSGSRTSRVLAEAYVTLFTNTPQLVQIFFIFFALPEFGVQLSSYQAVLVGMTLNAGAYLTEIQRAGFASVRRSEVEAAETLGMSRLQVVRYVIVPHIMKVLFPPLSSHYIVMTLGTSMGALFGLEELTGRAFNVESRTFRSLEIFTIVAGVYLALNVVASAVLVVVGRVGFRVRVRLV
jgi:polar amino acid transport system permease protein